MREENKVTQEQRDYLAKIILDYLGNYMITQDDIDHWFSLKTITVGEIMKKTKKSTTDSHANIQTCISPGHHDGRGKK